MKMLNKKQNKCYFLNKKKNKKKAQIAKFGDFYTTFLLQDQNKNYSSF